MHNIVTTTIFLAILIANIGALPAQQSNPEDTSYAIAIHGGAGTISRDKITEEQEKAYRDKLREALQTGYAILKTGGSSFDAVEATIKVMEDSPLFNSGKGAVFTADGTNELDAAIMDGKTLEAGAVTGVMHIKNPISLARLVLEKSPHVLMTGRGAEDFAVQNGVPMVSNYYFHTEKRWESLKKAKQEQEAEKDSANNEDDLDFTNKETGTVGCVALDRDGNLAAGTSTGGLTNKMYGRVGDSPIIGAGTYANNQTCAISGTGQGEYFMRLLVAHDVHALMAYKNMSLADAANEVILQKLDKLGGKGGIVAIDRNGNVAMPFNTKGMYRGYVNRKGELVVKIYGDE